MSLIMFELQFNIAIYFVCCVCGGRNNVEEVVFKLHLRKLIPTEMMLTTKYPAINHCIINSQCVAKLGNKAKITRLEVIKLEDYLGLGLFEL